MNKIALTAGAVLALSVMTAPSALAQDDSNACDKARIAEAAALKDLRGAEKDLDRARAAAKSGVAASLTIGSITIVIDDKTDVNDAERAGIDALKGVVDRAQKALDKAVDKREDRCATPETTTPAPTTTVVPDPDVDCDEVSDDEAQRILDADRSDPNDLDQDRDGIACEDDEILPAPVDDTPSVAVPSGGVATGVGPE
jgi:hypothetical protein